MIGATTRSTFDASITRPSAAGQHHVRLDEQRVVESIGAGPRDVEHRELSPLDHRGLDERDVEALRVVPAAADVADRHDPVAAHVRLEGGVLTDVAEALHGDGDVPTLRGERATEVVEQRLERDDRAASGRDRAAERAAELDGLAGDDARLVAVDARVRVEEVRHRRRVRPHVGRGDVGARTDRGTDRLDVAPGDELALARAQRARIDRDPALRAAERQVDERGLPRHQLGEAPHVVEVDRRVEAEPTLERPTDVRVLDPEAGEHPHPAVIADDGDLDGEFAVGGAQAAGELVADPEPCERRLRRVGCACGHQDLRGIGDPHSVVRLPSPWCGR
jgi:hypothetical protein